MLMTQEVAVAPEPTLNAPEAAQDQMPEIADPEAEESTQQDAQDEQPNEADKSLKRMERRIQRLTAAKYQTLAEAQQARAEVEALKQRLAQYEQPSTEPAGPDPLVLAKEISRIEKVAEKSNAIAKDGAARFDGFEKAVQAVARDVGAMFDRIGRPTGLGEAILAADDPAAVINAIGLDPDLAGELGEMSPIQQARRIAKLEAELSKPAEPKASTAPKPIAPVKGAGGGTKDPALMSDAEFAQWRKEQIKARRGY